MAGEKVKYAPVDAVTIEVTRNGYRLKVGKPPAANVTIEGHSGKFLVTDGCSVSWSSFCEEAKPAKKVKAKPSPPRTIYSSGEYVFPDFASLSAWLKARVTVAPE